MQNPAQVNIQNYVFTLNNSYFNDLLLLDYTEELSSLHSQTPEY